MPLTKTLTRHGNSWALILDKPILDLLDVTDQTQLALNVVDGTLLIVPLRDEEEDPIRRRIREASARVHKRYHKVFERLSK
jgi:antitoxin MazE